VILNNITLISVCGNNKFLNGIINAANYCTKNIKFGSVKILSDTVINCDNIEIIKIPSLNQEEYSTFCLYELTNYIDTEYCLTFQGDGFIINPHLWKDEFLQYDYIGAPWLNEKNNNVGNGGFSLRSQKFLQSAKTLDYNSKIQFQPHIPAGKLITPEDWFACNYKHKEMTDMGIKFADVDLAYKFSVEHPSFIKRYDRNNLQTYNSFGFHGSFNTAAMKLLETQ
jgi:hypothetical protein